MRPNIAFDIDGVVANFSAAFVPYAKRRYGLNFIPKDKFHWDVEPDLTPMLFEKVIAWFIRDHSNKIKVKADGATLVDYVWEKTQKPILFITARHEMTCSATHHWFKSYFSGMDFVIITVNSGKDKHRFLDDYDVYVEDRRRTVLDLAQKGKTVIMPIRDYNWPLGNQNYMPYGDLNDGMVDRIIPVESLIDITDGSFDHLIFKK